MNYSTLNADGSHHSAVAAWRKLALVETSDGRNAITSTFFGFQNVRADLAFLTRNGNTGGGCVVCPTAAVVLAACELFP